MFGGAENIVSISDQSSAGDLHDLFMEAANTEQWMPVVRQQVGQTWWPEMQSEWLAYADTDATIRLTPSSLQIDRYYLAIQIALSLKRPDRELVWAVAFSAVRRSRGPQWKAIAKHLHLDRRTVRNRYMAIIVNLSMALRAATR